MPSRKPSPKKATKKMTARPKARTVSVAKAAVKKEKAVVQKTTAVATVTASAIPRKSRGIGYTILELSFGFCAGAVVMMVLQLTITSEMARYYAKVQSTLPAQIVTTGQEEDAVTNDASGAAVECQTDQDCISPIEICSATHSCSPLLSPVGQCTQPMVLTYTERSTGRTKHTFCERGCRITPQGARCM